MWWSIGVLEGPCGLQCLWVQNKYADDILKMLIFFSYKSSGVSLVVVMFIIAFSSSWNVTVSRSLCHVPFYTKPSSTYK